MSDTVTLKEYLEVQIQSIKDATILAKESMERRLDGMNEFRDTLKDQASRFLTRDEYDSKHELLRQQLGSIQKLVYIGFGIMITIEFLLGFFKK